LASLEEFLPPARRDNPSNFSSNEYVSVYSTKLILPIIKQSIIFNTIKRGRRCSHLHQSSREEAGAITAGTAL